MFHTKKVFLKFEFTRESIHFRQHHVKLIQFINSERIFNVLNSYNQTCRIKHHSNHIKTNL
ncbi:hypothetical protein PIL02S_06216 [Paenibacillus illinoisensis]|uniref:Uncharacterized protein n=1 Tax=Paenibacillus illinoisensis TaxID=59845 RepID=A0A2W0CSW6_9BACL|nr:hypothetical protein PIL02S_06216 [Paenibacillus illinoisensis]